MTLDRVWRPSAQTARQAAWLLGAAALLVLGAEILLSLFSRGVDHLPGFFAPSQDGTYRLAARSKTRYWHSGRIVTVTIGADGRRIVPSAPAEATTMLHVIGDSQVFGWGLSDDETLPERLQQQLGPDVRVVNHGLPGLGPLGYVRRAAELPPDDPVIILMTEMNDFQDSYDVLPSLTHHCGFIVLPNGIGKNLPCLVLRAQVTGLLMDFRKRLLAERIPLPLGFNPYAKISARVLCERIENTLAAFIKRRPGATVLATIPWEAEILPSRLASYAPALDETVPHTRLPGGEILHGALKRNGRAAELFLPDDHHLSAMGADIVARLLAGMHDWRARQSRSRWPDALECQYF